MDKRPQLNKTIKLNDFKDFYWLKEELIDFCRKIGLKSNGGKIEITERIEYYLETGVKEIKNKRKKANPDSKFDWNSEKLTTETLITDNYKNTENVRLFFTKQIGKRFKFNVKFMNWIKSNVGKTLKDAINEWKKIELEKKDNKNTTEIAPQFEYNQYIRDFLKDNKNSTRKEVIKYWKIKKSIRGNNIYNKSDLNFK